jgi:D-sedoheptulose 7-phosphate isomerase
LPDRWQSHRHATSRSFAGYPACFADLPDSAIANDTGFDMVFAQQVYGIGHPGDVLLGISTSGKSKNVVNAVILAKAFGLKTIILTGRSGGTLAPMADVA